MVCVQIVCSILGQLHQFKNALKRLFSKSHLIDHDKTVDGVLGIQTRVRKRRMMQGADVSAEL